MKKNPKWIKNYDFPYRSTFIEYGAAAPPTLSISFSISLYFLLRSSFSFGIVCCNFNRCASAVRSFVSAALHSVCCRNNKIKPENTSYDIILQCNRHLPSTQPNTQTLPDSCDTFSLWYVILGAHAISPRVFHSQFPCIFCKFFEHLRWLFAIEPPSYWYKFPIWLHDLLTLPSSGWPSVASMSMMKTSAIVRVCFEIKDTKLVTII